MNNEVDFQYVAKQECLPLTICKQLKNSFNEHKINLNEDCLTQLVSVVVSILKAVGNGVVQTHGQFDIVKGLKQEYITPADVQLLIQYDLYQQLERSNEIKNINYNTLKDISREIVTCLTNYKLEDHHAQQIKVKG